MPKSHPKCLNLNWSQFPPWNSYIINNHDRLHLLLWSPHLILRNHSSQPQALWNIQHHQPMTLHCFQFLHPLHFKFPPLTIIMVNHTTINTVQSQLMLQEAVLRNQMEVLDLLLSLYTSPINNKHDEHHTNKRGMHFRRYGLELLLWDIHLRQIWNLQTRTGVMLWSLILSGTGMISSSQTLFLFSTVLCASSITSFCHRA